MNDPIPRWRPGLRVFTAVMRLPLPKRWRLEPAKLGWSSKELVSPRGDRIPFRMKSKIEIANNVMRRVSVPAKDAKGAKDENIKGMDLDRVCDSGRSGAGENR